MRPKLPPGPVTVGIITWVVDVRLVPLTPVHVPDLLAARADPEVLRFTRTPAVVTEEWLRRWLTELDGRHRFGWAVVDAHGAFLGYAVTGPMDHEGGEARLGYAVAGLLRVTALVSTSNGASSAVARRAGFTLEGVLRSVHHRDDERVDLECWSMLPGELPAAWASAWRAGWSGACGSASGTTRREERGLPRPEASTSTGSRTVGSQVHNG